MDSLAEENSYVKQICLQACEASHQLRLISGEQKNTALKNLAELLYENRQEIKINNAQDIEEAQKNGITQAMIDRLSITDKEIDSMIGSLEEIALLKDPVKEVITGWQLPNGLHIEKIRIPIGVIAIIYESRPNVTVDVGGLGLKSSNAVILRGGKEAIQSNKILTDLFQKALARANIPRDAVQLVEKVSRDVMRLLLKREGEIDLIVPRGGEGLIKFVSEHSLIPVVKHDKGVCHLYVHASAPKETALNILLNGKMQRPGVCNALESVLFDRGFPYTIEILREARKKGIIFHADSKTQNKLKELEIAPLTEEGYHKEYLSLDISLKIVDDLEHAISHIQTYGSSHSEVIISEDNTSIQKFLDSLDSAALFVNASTRFHDGNQFGLGAEVGISTGKLHARGPMGLSDLTTSKYIVRGQGQIRE